MDTNEQFCEKCGYDVRLDVEMEREEFSWRLVDYLKDLGSRIASLTL